MHSCKRRDSITNYFLMNFFIFILSLLSVYHISKFTKKLSLYFVSSKKLFAKCGNITQNYSSYITVYNSGFFSNLYEFITFFHRKFESQFYRLRFAFIKI